MDKYKYIKLTTIPKLTSSFFIGPQYKNTLFTYKKYITSILKL